MDKEQILRKAAKIKNTVSRYNFRVHTLVTVRQALKAMDEVEKEALKISSNTSNTNNATVLPAVLSKYNIWICYNRYGRTGLENIDETISEFLKVTSGENKHCSCNPSKGKAVNNIWDGWHCTYCLKPVLAPDVISGNEANQKILHIGEVSVCNQLCPNCKSNDTKKHYSGHKCLKCKSVFWA